MHRVVRVDVPTLRVPRGLPITQQQWISADSFRLSHYLLPKRWTFPMKRPTSEDNAWTKLTNARYVCMPNPLRYNAQFGTIDPLMRFFVSFYLSPVTAPMVSITNFLLTGELYRCISITPWPTTCRSIMCVCVCVWTQRCVLAWPAISQRLACDCECHVLLRQLVATWFIRISHSEVSDGQMMTTTVQLVAPAECSSSTRQLPFV